MFFIFTKKLEIDFQDRKYNSPHKIWNFFSCFSGLWYEIVIKNIFISTKEFKINLNTSLAAKWVLAHRLQRRTACKIQNGRQGAPKWRTGSGKGCTPGFLGILSNFR